MGEQVIRHRGGGRDENGQLVPATQVTMTAIAVAPGAGTERLALGRDGENIDCVVYFTPDVDIVNADELTVRGNRFRIIVNDWHPLRPGSSVAGLEVMCMRGQG
jgi:hypothetical protein